MGRHPRQSAPTFLDTAWWRRLLLVAAPSWRPRVARRADGTQRKFRPRQRRRPPRPSSIRHGGVGYCWSLRRRGAREWQGGPMGRSGSSARVKVEARPAATRKSRKVDSSAWPQRKQRLAEALKQNAAISEILQVISASPSDVQPVLDAVAERAARLCEAPLARVLLVDGDVLRAMAEYSLDGASQARTVSPHLRRTSIVGRAVLDRTTIHHNDC